MRRFLALLLMWLATWTLAPAVFAAQDAGGASARVAFFVMTTVIALLIGLVLYYYAQRSASVKYRADETDTANATDRPEVAAARAVLPVVLQELGQVPASVQQRQRIARNVSDIVERTVQQQVGTVKQQLSDEFNKSLQEERRVQTQLHQKYETALAEKQQTVSVLSSIAEGLVVVNNKGEVMMMNPAAEKLLAMNLHESVGKQLSAHMGDAQLLSLVGGSEDNREIVVTAKQENTKRVLRASNAVITDEDGRTVGMVAVLSDVTKQKELDELKSEFVSKVGHELRTPLLSMQHALSILTDGLAGTLSEEQQKFVSLVQRNAERLSGLINDLLDLSKIEAKQMTLRLEHGSIIPVIESVCESLDAWASSKTLKIIKRLPAGLPPVRFDPARLTQVLTNLIGNAIKFTPKQGRITIDAAISKDQQWLEVGVADTGIGIAKEDLPKLFQKFQQVGERTATDISGTGLGLAIAKELIELHRGRIWAESALHQGARFVFALPLEPPAS